MDRTEVIRTLEEIGALLGLKGENVFKVRAFENGARAIAELSDFEERVRRGDFGGIPGIGKALSEIVSELVATGRSTVREELRAEIPDGVLEIQKIRGLGPKKALALYRDLGIASLEELEVAIHENRLVTLPGFGAKTQEKIASGLSYARENERRFRLPEAYERAEAAKGRLLSGEGAAAGVGRVEVAGDLRRFLETVTEIVLVVECVAPAKLPAFPEEAGAPPIRLVPTTSERFGNTWLLETGSPAHVAALCERGASALQAPARTEEEIHRRLGLPFVPPELREGRGEIEAAAAGRLPELVSEKDIRGVFHVHTTHSDGRASMHDMLRRAAELGHAYVGLTDHSPAAAYARGLSPDRVDAQWAEIAALAPRFPNLRIFRGTEADILPDGSIDYGDAFLARFDFVIASVHSHFHLSRTEQTERLLRAVRNPRVTLLGHATDRLLLARKGIDVDLEKVLAAAAGAGTGVELNASPHRLELDWRLGPLARELGVFTSINPDAHDVAALENVRWGVGIARKAGFTRADVLNTGDTATIEKRLAQSRARG